eukprot:15434625-Alexandrium_andersonii.AAC.1
MNHLRKLERQGQSGPITEYRSLTTDGEGRGFALRIRLDPEGTFCSVKETSGVKVENEATRVRGWMAIWEVAQGR